MNDGRMRLFCIMSSVGFKSDFLVAAARGVMLRTSPQPNQGEGHPLGYCLVSSKVAEEEEELNKN